MKLRLLLAFIALFVLAVPASAQTEKRSVSDGGTIIHVVMPSYITGAFFGPTTLFDFDYTLTSDNPTFEFASWAQRHGTVKFTVGSTTTSYEIYVQGQPNVPRYRTIAQPFTGKAGTVVHLRGVVEGHGLAGQNPLIMNGMVRLLK